MNTTNDLLVAIDIGTTKVILLVGKENENGKIDILSQVKLPSKGVENGIIRNVTSIVNVIRKAFEIAENELGFPIENVWIETGVAGDYIRCFAGKTEIARKDPEELISKEELDKLRQQMRNSTALQDGHIVLDVLDQALYVDDKLVTESVIGMKGKRLSGAFRIITGRAYEINNFKSCVGDAKKNIFTSQPMVQPIASAAATLTEREKTGGVILIDIGGGTTDIAIFSDGILRHTAMIGYGGNYITEYIQEAHDVTFNEAEALKTKHGGLVLYEADEHSNITINPILKNGNVRTIRKDTLKKSLIKPVKTIFSHVLIEINHYKNEIGKNFENRIILTGGGSLLQDIDGATSYVLGGEVRLGEPTLHLSEESLQKCEELLSPVYSTAIGLLVHTLEKQKKTLEEEKEDEIRESIISNKKTIEPQIPQEVLPEEETTQQEEEPITEPISENPQTKKGCFPNIFSKILEKLDKKLKDDES